MNKKKNNQIVVFLMGDKGVGKTFIANRMLQKFGFNKKVSIAETVRNLAMDPAIFNIAPKYFEPELKNEPFACPIQIRESNIRRIVNRLSDLLPLSENFRPSRIAVSNFPTPIIKTPRELLQFIGFSVINKINPSYTALLAYNSIVGIPGSFVVDDLRLQSDYDFAASKLQIIYTVLVESSSLKRKTSTGEEPYFLEEYDWRRIVPDFKISNNSSLSKLDQSIQELLIQIFSSVDEKSARGSIGVLQSTLDDQNAQWANSRGPLGQKLQNAKTFQSGKAIFDKGNVESMHLSKDKINFYHNEGDVDRSDLKR